MYDDQQDQMKQFFNQYLKEKLNNKDSSEGSNSFVFLENNTLQMLITYLFMQLENQQRNSRIQEIPQTELKELEQVIDEMIVENQTSNQEIIELLKAKI